MIQFGGIVALNLGRPEAEIEKCTNTGNITGGNQISGIIGECTGKIMNCYNSGNIVIVEAYKGSQPRTAGIAFGGDIVNCYNTGDITGYNLTAGISTWSENVENCYNTGRIISVDGYAGGISSFGENDLKCYNSGNILSKKSGGRRNQL